MTFLSRGIDYLGDLAAKLRDLQGFRTLAHELIQNADDAEGVSGVTFDVCDKALVVENDASFSDCGSLGLAECPWKENPQIRHRCDFHRFRLVAGGDKREQEGTTGAFGIGFIAVYQITDHPEILSGGHHWILHEDGDEKERIKVCGGCDQCKRLDLPATQFVLPWATDGGSPLRVALRAAAVGPGVRDSLTGELEATSPHALLFLKRVVSIAIKRNGRLLRRLERLSEGDSVILTDGQKRNEIWHLIRGEFLEEAADLRAKHPGLIEEKRKAAVTVAIPESDLGSGLLFACLPTQHETGLPFHVNADFFPGSDRKRIIFETDYQSEWNRLAVRTAARIVAGALDGLPRALGHKRLWKVIARVSSVAQEVKRGEKEEALGWFWGEIEPTLKNAKILYTSAGDWKPSSDVVIPLQVEEHSISKMLEKIGLSILHEDLREHFTLLRSPAIAVPLLDITRLTSSLIKQGLTTRYARNAWPAWVGGRAGLEDLWAELSLLVDRQGARTDASLRELRKVAIAIGSDGALWPCEQVFAADRETQSLFGSVDKGIAFLADGFERIDILSKVCPRFDARAAVNVLRRIESTKLEERFENDEFDIKILFEWFNDRRSEVLKDERTKAALCELPIFPSSGRLRRLSEVSLPGDFHDPLGLASVIDVAQLGGRHEFLRDLGISVLDLAQYAKVHLALALKGEDVPDAKRREAVLLLARNIGKIKDQTDIRNALADTPIVECVDRVFRVPRDVYFDSEPVRDCLVDGFWTARTVGEHSAAIVDLLTWVGVAGRPRLHDLALRIRALVASAPSPESISRIQKIFGYLAEWFEIDQVTPDLEELRSVAWLPARGRSDRWYRPSEVYAVFQEYLFASQALFLDVPQDAQQAGSRARSGWLDWLGIKDTPSNEQVVKHLIHCAETNQAVNKDVYRHLNLNASDVALNRLVGKVCLLMPDGRYVSGSQAFWGEHPFGRFRIRLGRELQQYSALLDRLRVRQSPGWEDSQRVLIDISTAFGESNSALDDEANSVLMTCWRNLEKALADGSAPNSKLEELKSRKCVANKDRVLIRPEWMFFEDRAGLVAEFGEFLNGHVIARPIDAGIAMTAAGVRALAAAVQVRLTECSDAVEAREVAERVFARRTELARVLSAQSDASATGEALQHVGRMRFESAGLLEVQYVLSAFNQEVASLSKQVPALFGRQQETIFFVPTNGSPPWLSVARELAIALYPEEEPGRIASALKEVLAAGTADEAKAALDELGFAALDLAETAGVASGETVSSLGGDEPPVHAGGTPGPTGEAEPPLNAESMSPRDAINSILGPDVPSPSASTGGQEQPGGWAGNGTAGGASATPTGGTKRRGRLRSYVISGENGKSNGQAPGKAEVRSAIEQAGVDKVVEYERANGCDPVVMPPNHPGYDIESTDRNDSRVRYIEVKSTAGDWGEMGVGVSRTQFERAQQLGDQYWLYVVERAEQTDARIVCIRNPARRVDQFMFDDGWRSAAEAAEAAAQPET